MVKIIQKFPLIAGVLVIILACASPATVTFDPNLAGTAIAGTSAAAQTQTARAQVPFTASPTSTVTKPPSPTPFPSFTPIVLLPPQIRVTKNTNCRAGPGQVYDKVGALRAGDVADVVGRSSDGRWWIIRNPNGKGKVCWLVGTYASVTGVAGALPILTPPPTPKPTRTPTRKPAPTRTTAPPTSTNTTSVPSTPNANFVLSYSHMESCPSIGWWADVQLENNGGIMFQSISMAVRDTVTNDIVTSTSDDFTDRDSCDQVNWDNLPYATDRVVSLPAFTYDPAGHEIQAAIMMCTDTGQGGTCVTQIIRFTP